MNKRKQDWTAKSPDGTVMKFGQLTKAKAVKKVREWMMASNWEPNTKVTAILCPENNKDEPIEVVVEIPNSISEEDEEPPCDDANGHKWELNDSCEYENGIEKIYECAKCQAKKRCVKLNEKQMSVEYFVMVRYNPNYK